eukprot:CAMPEP_0175959388 /NCGR_PEP_ID=MMETSP0108-20121206/34772_1 /TAXON_ID=195067 ORGANISM="Goniomonas pacifica, Strain CCMP1869" /NCGR_SAMPLE_ID=MMETSP0108 /ASSEMBLY_ACC=CAM_ASM_000204 /LENGTH=75 /DNA_ID=CAMNT_0017286841 /DNA_START=1 /DNA_END=225 /DNA_ORIENTATION=+
MRERDILSCTPHHGQERTPLHGAALHGHLEVSQVLIGAGANVHATEQEGTPLHLSAVKGCLELCQMLVGAGANVH